MLKRYMYRFFRWYCNPAYFEDIEGDLEEIFQQQLESGSRRSAEWQYTREVLLLFRPTIIRPIRFINLQHTLSMFQNYLKIGLRNLLKYRTNTAIHIWGLAIGLAAFLLINQYVSFERSYDRFHPHADHIYRLTTDVLEDGQLQLRDAMTYAPAAKTLEEALPEVINSTTTLKIMEVNFRRKGRPIQEDMIAVDTQFLKMFNYPLLAGDPNDLLVKPNSLVLTESHARKYFGKENPIGQSIEYLSGKPGEQFVVRGIVADPPENTHYGFNMLTSTSTVQKRMEREAWNGNNYYSYLLLDERADLAVVNEKLKDLAKQFISEDGFELFNLQPLTDIHLHSDMTFEPEVHGSARAVNFLYLISIFILLIAWINYINLSTARAVERAREVGMRKVVGARKIQLIGQFFTEALLVNLLGVLLAVLLVQLTLPYFNQLVGKTVMTGVEGNPLFLKNLLLFFIMGTLVTGIYPSMILSSFKPIGVLKGSFNRSKHGVALRKGLVIFQFTTSLVLIVGTIVIYQQIQYMMNREMGMKTQQVLSFNAPACSGEFEQCKSKRKAFQNELKQLKGVRGVANMACLPGGRSSDINSTYGEFSIPGAAQPFASTLYINFMDDQLADLLDLKFAAGRNFDFQLASDSNAVLINQAMLDLFDITDPETVINKELVRTNGFRFRIVGVLEDFNRSTLKYTIEPTFFIPDQISDFGLVKLEVEDIRGTIAAIEKNYLRFFPNASFNPVFLDDRFAQLYVEDQKFGSVFSIFSVLAIFVAMMGLFGLAAFLSLQRTKEVGVRKVLGASTWQIILLFFRDFVGLVSIGLLIGAPLVYYGMNNWLSTYAFRIDFPWWSLLLGMVALMLLTFLTVSFQTYRVASINPAETMRTE